MGRGKGNGRRVNSARLILFLHRFFLPLSSFLCPCETFTLNIAAISCGEEKPKENDDNLTCSKLKMETEIT
ncbi:hypothetical protein F2P81_015003 [Scophthalmus maximus]|uniref:Secreted protein n=1 Tax=Scophthalmus maximus TaxID=52904 RepID=A0A6A4SEX6_SCOMX|nr:hypothetical protein F2P81_015003 [Scophthalmus maximus]